MRAMRAVAVAVLSFTATSLFAARTIPLRNWSHPVRVISNGAIGGSAVFVAVTPCRIVDTRLANGPYGGPGFAAGMTRTFNIPGGPCSGIPAAAAYSLNFTVVGFAAGGGFVTAFPAGTTRPGTSTVTYGRDPAYAVANAAIVPANATGSIDVYASDSTQLIVDIDGYFIEPGGTITGVIAGTGLTGGGTSGNVTLNVNFAGNGSANTVARSDHSPFDNITIVTAGSDATDNGTRLRSAAAGTTAMIFLEPGTYDLGAQKLVLAPHKKLKGSGKQTIVTCSDTATIELQAQGGENEQEIESLTVFNTYASGGKGISAPTAQGNISIANVDVSVSASASGSSGIWIDGASAGQARPVLKSINVTANGDNAIALRVWGSTYRMEDIHISGGGAFTGVDDRLGGKSTIERVTIVGGGAPVIGMLFGLQSTPTISHAAIKIVGGTSACAPLPACTRAVGIQVQQVNSGRTIIRDSSIDVTANGGAESVGILAETSALFGVMNSDITGGTYAVSPGANRSGMGFPGVSYFQSSRLKGTTKAIDDPGCGFTVTHSVVDGGATGVCANPVCALSVNSALTPVDSNCN